MKFYGFWLNLQLFVRKKIYKISRFWIFGGWHVCLILITLPLGANSQPYNWRLNSESYLGANSHLYHANFQLFQANTQPYWCPATDPWSSACVVHLQPWSNWNDCPKPKRMGKIHIYRIWQCIWRFWALSPESNFFIHFNITFDPINQIW